MRILIVKLGAIGDIVHTLPSLAVIRAAYPVAELTWVVESRSAEILRGNPLIDNLIEIDTRALRTKSVQRLIPEIRRQIGEIRKLEFDIAIDFHGLVKSAVVGKISGAKKRWGFSQANLREPAARLLLTDTADVPSGVHVIRKNLELASAALGVDGPRDGFEFPIASGPAALLEASAIIERTGEDFVILNPAGGWITKLWPAEQFGLLADELWTRHGLSSIVTGGPADAVLTQRVVDASRSAPLLAVQPSLKGFFELAKRARLYIGGDTGPTHIAMAAGAPIVGIFGPTEWWRNGSINPDDVCLERIDIGCRIDCHRRNCSNWICMDIDVKAAADAVALRLGRSVSSTSGGRRQKTVDALEI